ncbi:MAG: hypothetical protein Q9219_000724 [cf. Caloplaca sp. 3 TL-2023]
MSSAVATLVSSSLPSLESTRVCLPLTFRRPGAEPKPSKTESRRIVFKASSTKPLQFLNITQDPEVERRSTKNRRTVRSNAIKHAVQVRKQPSHQLTENQSLPSRREGEDDISHADFASVREPLQISRKESPRSVWPIGTVAARTNFAELNLVSIHFQKIKSHYSIFSHLLDTPDSDKDLASVVLQSPIIYHATLYVATKQQTSCAFSFGNGVRNPLIHEAIVLRSVQDVISKSALPQDDVIFAVALLGISQPKRRDPSRDIADDVEYGHVLQAPFNLRPQNPCHGSDESLRPSEGISFMFLARRRMLYMEIAQNLSTLVTPVRRLDAVPNQSQRHAAMLALSCWQPIRLEVEHDLAPQLDESARLAGLLYYHLVYEGGTPSLCTTFKVMQLPSELLKLCNNQHVFSLLYHGCSNRLCLILWILYCGGVFATGPLRTWYADKINSVSGGTGKDWTRTKEILKYFAWDEDACAIPMRRLWLESLATDEVGEYVPLSTPLEVQSYSY